MSSPKVSCSFPLGDGGGKPLLGQTLTPRADITEPGVYLQVGTGPPVCMWTEIEGPVVVIKLSQRDALFIGNWLIKKAGGEE